MISVLKSVRVSEVLFLFAGIGLLISLPWLDSWGLWVWFLAKVAYFSGLVFLLSRH